MRSLENQGLNIPDGSESLLRGQFDFNKMLDIIARLGKGTCDTFE